jgi:hypothetical protein
MAHPCIHLPARLAAWGSAKFEASLRAEIEALAPRGLPLQQALSHTSYASDAPVQVRVLGAEEQGDAIHARIGVFFAGIIAGCSCADDPTPAEEQIEYCELLLEIDKHSGQARGTLLED